MTVWGRVELADSLVMSYSITEQLEMARKPKFGVHVRFGFFDDKGLVLFGF